MKKNEVYTGKVTEYEFPNKGIIYEEDCKITVKIFDIIENDHSGILATMKAYRIPYPIAKILIKKIIKISLDNCNK